MSVFRAVLPFVILLCTSCMDVGEEFQRDADVIRLEHLEYYAELIEEYHTKTGHYPFENEETVPIWVFVAHERQIGFTEPGPAYEHVRVPFTEFVDRVEEGLGREIDERYDPQFAPDDKPNFYTYVVGDGVYYFTIHVNEAFPFAHGVSAGYHRVVVSNLAQEGNQAFTPRDLFAREDFRAARVRVVRKRDFFDAREADFLHHTREKPVTGRQRRG